jgi:DNA-binding PadR family transcriptional regulator
MTERAFNMSERLMRAPDLAGIAEVRNIDRAHFDELLKDLTEARNGRLAPVRLTTLEATVLAAILECPTEESYGYELSRNVGSPTGSLYKTLGRLERRGLALVREEDASVAEDAGRPPRRLYKVTSRGESELGYWRAAQLRHSPSARFLA